MRFTSLLMLSLMLIPQAFGSDHFELWEDLREDYKSKSYFSDFSINYERDGVMSPFIRDLFKDDYNNARPLTPYQLKHLPPSRFVSPEIFHLAMQGRSKLIKAKKIKAYPLLAIVDFTQSARTRRLYIMDLDKREVLINTWVSHATGSDKNNNSIPETFSNVAKSNLSSVGFMSTDNTYYGQWGYSLRIRGLDKVLNSNVFSRAVVFHGSGSMGAHEASWGMSQTSQGCFMTPMIESGRFWGMRDEPLYKIVNDTLKAGALVFAYTDVMDNAGKPLILNSDWLDESDIMPEREEEEVEEEIEEEVEELPIRDLKPVPVIVRPIETERPVINIRPKPVELRPVIVEEVKTEKETYMEWLRSRVKKDPADT